MNVGTKKTLRYMLLPELLPRIKALGFSGLGPVALFMAYVYRAARLLPAGHPYLNAANKGRFGIIQVIFEAKRNLVFKRENIDQILIFLIIPLALFILALQFVLLFFALSTQMAQAAGFGTYAATTFFTTANPEEDIAFMLLDGVFGVDGLYNSKVDVSAAWGPWPTPFHIGLHKLFEFYSLGLFYVAVLILVYYTITLVGETAVSGVPFGQRFNGAWTPIRLIVALALLAPTANGLNGAQFVTLYMAKWGSGLATNAWTKFNKAIEDSTILGDADRLVGTPNEPNISGLMEFMSLVRTCGYMYEYVHDQKIKSYIVQGKDAPKDFMATDYDGALTFTENGNIVVRFGAHDPGDAYEYFDSKVRPFCGDIVLNPADVSSPGGKGLQEAYYILIKDLWENSWYDFYAEMMAERVTPTIERDNWSGSPFPDGTDQKLMISEYYDPSMPTAGRDSSLWSAWGAKAFAGITAPSEAPVLGDMIRGAVNMQVTYTGGTSDQPKYWTEQFVERGWAGAAIWYSKIAEMNGSLIAASKMVPSPARYPEVMELVREQGRQASRGNTGGDDTFKPVLPNGKRVEFDNPGDEHIALALYYAQSFWFNKHGDSSGNVMQDSARLMLDLDGISSLFGLEGLFSMTKNVDIHPLAQLVGVGAGLIQNSVNKFTYALGTGVASKIMGFMKWNDGATIAGTASSFMTGLATFGLSLGFILYYVIPFMPFVYFFFAVGNWVKAIFEAMVGMPLWALAHMRIDGEGLPGPGAMNGYYLLLDILLRPILIIFGFLASIAFFSAQVYVLHEIWTVVLVNLTGFDDSAPATVGFAHMRSAVDSLFYTVIYAIIVYMLGMSSFKMVDLIPNHLMRWLGSGVEAFAEHTQDPAQGLVQNIYIGSGTVMGQMSGATAGLLIRN